MLSGVGILWSLASPLPSGPDEPAQIIKAAAVAHGELIGKHTASLPPPTTLVRVPETANEAGGHQTDVCDYARTGAPVGGCLTPLHPSSRTVVASTYVGRYPPLYYAIVGLPSLASSHAWSLRAMRMVSALACALFLGLAMAAAAAWTSSRWLVIGVALAITPVALYTAAVVNPNGFEICTAIAAWTTGTILVFDRSQRPPAGLLAAFVASTIACDFTRPLSFAWMAALVVTLVVIRPRAALRLWRDRRVKVAVGLVALGCAGAAAYVVAAHSLLVEDFPLPKGLSNGYIAKQLAELIPSWIYQFIGSYGSPNFGGPALATALWLVAASLLLVAGLLTGRRREAAWLALFVVGALGVVPFVATYTHARLHGFGWQGRYNYPLAAGIPIVAAALLGRRPLPSAARAAAAGVWVVGQGASMYWVLLRYTVGLGHTLDPLTNVSGHWRSLFDTGLFMALGASAVIVFGAWVWTSSAPARLRPAHLSRRPARTAVSGGSRPRRTAQRPLRERGRRTGGRSGGRAG